MVPMSSPTGQARLNLDRPIPQLLNDIALPLPPLRFDPHPNATASIKGGAQIVSPVIKAHHPGLEGEPLGEVRVVGAAGRRGPIAEDCVVLLVFEGD